MIVCDSDRVLVVVFCNNSFSSYPNKPPAASPESSPKAVASGSTWAWKALYSPPWEQQPRAPSDSPRRRSLRRDRRRRRRRRRRLRRAPHFSSSFPFPLEQRPGYERVLGRWMTLLILVRPRLLKAQERLTLRVVELSLSPRKNRRPLRHPSRTMPRSSSSPSSPDEQGTKRRPDL